MFQLLERLPEKRASGYWSHNSGGEHTNKHYGDIGDINALRTSRGLGQINPDTLENFMYINGVLAVRQYLRDGGVGDIVGYGVVDRTDTDGQLSLEDLWVAEAQRGKGIGGYILGDLLTNRPYDVSNTKQFYGKTITMGGASYRLPNMRISLFDLSKKDAAEFKAKMPSDWSGILSLSYGDETEESLLFQNGSQSHAFLNHNGRFRIDDDGSKRLYDNEAIAAIAALNMNV